MAGDGSHSEPIACLDDDASPRQLTPTPPETHPLSWEVAVRQDMHQREGMEAMEQ